MLKVDIHEELVKGHQKISCQVEVDGDLFEVCNDLRILVGNIYSSINKQMPLEAAVFKAIMKSSIKDPEFWAQAEAEDNAAEGTSIITYRDKKK